MSSATYGYSGDSFGSIYYFWWWKHAFQNSLPFRAIPLQEAPFGIVLDQETGTAFFYWPVKLLSLITNATFAYNFILILSFPLAGLAVYFLVREVLRDRSGIGQGGAPDCNSELAAFICGLIFAFCPYHYWKAFQHLDFALTWCLPFFIYTLIRFEKAPDFKNSLLMAFGFLTTVLTNYYYGYFALLFVVIFGTVRLFQNLELRLSTRSSSSRSELLIRNLKRRYLNKKFLGLSALSFFCVVAVTVLLTYPVIKDARQARVSQESFVRRDSYKRPFLNLVSLSARPWDYVIPSQDNPLWGKHVLELYDWIQKQGSDFKTVSTFPHERTIYLGIVTILCALLSVFYYLRKKIRSGLYLPFLITAIVFFLISMPPYIFFKGRTIYFPSFLLYKIFPMFRSYVRVGVMVLICLLVVASFGMVRLFRNVWQTDKSLTSKVKSSKTFEVYHRKLVLLLSVALSLIVIFDFINIPPFKVTKFLPIPPAYAWLRERPGDLIFIEYPESFNVADGLLYQMYHQKPFLNFHTHSPYFGLWSSFGDFYDFRTAERLAALGVKYALIHKELLFPQENPVDDLWYTRTLNKPLDYKRVPPEFKLVEDFPKTAVYEVVTKDPPKMIIVVEKLSGIRSEAVGGTDWQWEKSENRMYFMNLVEGGKGPSYVKVSEGEQEMEDLGLQTTLTFDYDPESLRDFRALSFNGKNIDFNNSLDLILKPGENILLFENYGEASWEFSNIRLEI